MPFDLKISHVNPYLNGSFYLLQKRYETLSRFFASNSVGETAFENRVTYDTANSYLNQFLRAENCLPRKHGGANHVVVSDWIEAYIEALLLFNPMLYLRKREKESRLTFSFSPMRFHHFMPFVYVSKY